MFTYVPSFSSPEAVGRTTSAYSAVSVRKMSCTPTNSNRSIASRTFRRFASLRMGFSPMMYRPFRCPSSAASNISVTVSPTSGSRGTPHARSKRARSPGSSTRAYPGRYIGIAPMSEAPWTLFCPRRGLSPVPGRPMFPVSKARLISAKELSLPVVCWEIPIPQRIADFREPPYVRAASTRRSRGTPARRSTSSGVYGRTTSLSGSEPSVLAATKASSARPSSRITWMRPFRRATSVPGRFLRWIAAWRARGISRGSATMSLEPLRAACFRNVAITGWFSVVLEPITKRTSASPKSATVFDMEPLPIAVWSAYTLEEWHKRVQWSMFGVRRPARIIFWKR